MTQQIAKIKNEMAACVQDVIDGLESPGNARAFIRVCIENYPDLSAFGKVCLTKIEGA
jgi:hypothetical protein